MQFDPYIYKAKVLRVVDGDTLVVDIDLGLKVRLKDTIRLYGINTPETHGVSKTSAEYKAGMLSKERLIGLVEGKDVYLRTHFDKECKYGRLLADIYVDGHVDSVNTILLNEGLAKIALY